MIIQATTYKRLCGLLLCLLPLTVAGCGGSSGNGTSNVSQVQALTGTVLSPSGAPLAGYRVVYDQSSDLTPGAGTGLTTATNSAGQFTLLVPTSLITGSASLFIYNTAGSLVSKTVATPGGTTSITVTPPVPPVPPAGT